MRSPGPIAGGHRDRREPTLRPVALVSVWLAPPAADTTVCHDSERRRAAEFGTPALSARWLGARTVLRLILSEATDIPAADLRLDVADGGKPVLAGRPDVHFNLSHAGDLVAVAIADRPVGIDVEVRTTMRNPVGVARRLGLPAGTSDPETVLRAWVRTEALLKATGTGARAGLAGVEARLARSGWSVSDVPTGDDALAAVAAHGDRIDIRGPYPLPRA
jgi:4'-phosphopantetheinyl transferase